MAERTGTNKYTDAAYGPSNYVLNAYTSDSDCSQDSSDNEVLPLTGLETIKARSTVSIWAAVRLAISVRHGPTRTVAELGIADGL